MTGGEGVRVSALTIERAHHKKGTNGQTKRAPLQGVHTYLYPCPLSCLPTNLILHISSGLLLFVLTQACSVQALFASTLPMRNLTAEKRGLDPGKEGAKSADWHRRRPPDNLRRRTEEASSHAGLGRSSRVQSQVLSFPS